MPAKINVTNHISLHTWSRTHGCRVLPKFWRTGNYTGHQDNKNSYEANILSSLIFKVVQKHALFRIKHLRPPLPKRPIAETAAPSCPRPHNWGRFRSFWSTSSGSEPQPQEGALCFFFFIKKLVENPHLSSLRLAFLRLWLPKSYELKTTK